MPRPVSDWPSTPRQRPVVLAIRSSDPGRATLPVASSRDAAAARVTPDRSPTATSPVRTCVGCRSRSPATGLLRVVEDAGSLVPDPRRRLPGRGAWLHPDPECLRRAERRGAFPRALRVRGPLAGDALRHYLEPTLKCETVSHLDHESQVDPS
ncbi:YlxR family protein [Pseudonocardia spinosispora]|uniref:YlxR family protein n=1 Tax=Pseudonocardia spinosispora TaxID=103441 RepID=UPI000A037FF4